MSFALATLTAIALVFALAGYIKGVIGLGLPTIATGLMGLFLLPGEAASIVVVPALLTNIWQMWNGPNLIGLLRRLAPLLMGIMAGTIVTAGMLARGDVKVTVALLGGALIAYALYALANPRLSIPPRWQAALGLVAGVATGVISGSTGVFVVPSIPYVQALGLDKDDLVQAIGITAFTSALALGMGLGVHGGLRGDLVVPIGVAVAAAMAGMGLGQVLRAGLSHDRFRRWVLMGLMGLGAAMMTRLWS